MLRNPKFTGWVEKKEQASRAREETIEVEGNLEKVSLKLRDRSTLRARKRPHVWNTALELQYGGRQDLDKTSFSEVVGQTPARNGPNDYGK